MRIERKTLMIMNDEEKILNLLGRSTDTAAALEIALKLALSFITPPPEGVPGVDPPAANDEPPMP